MVSYYPLSITAATLTLNASTHSDVALTANRAAGQVLTLPAATGSGARYNIFVATTVTTNNLIVQVANSTDTMAGLQLAAQDSGDTAVAFETAADSDTITMNGSTKGGILGDRIELQDVASGKWSVRVVSSGTGTGASCFSAAV